MDAHFTENSRFEFSAQHCGSTTGHARSETHLLDFIEGQRALGIIATHSTMDDLVIVVLNRYGIKVTDLEQEEVFFRAPLETIVSVIYYVEQDGSHMVVLDTCKAHATNHGFHVFKFYDQTAAETFSQRCQEAFASLKAKVDALDE